MPALEARIRIAPPRWAVLQREVFNRSQAAAERFVERYVRSDGTLAFRQEWSGIDGADDPYEGFQALALISALGGGPRLLEHAHRAWEGITRQWTAYGQIHDEFAAGYDWMHTGEANHLLYWLSLADPANARDRERAVRFADLYAGADSPNYDAALRLVRSPLSGSRGPRVHVDASDWESSRWVLDMYPPPFEDLPEVPIVGRPAVVGSSAVDETQRPRSAWTNDDVYAAILERFNERMVRGDVPLNLISTGLATHAFIHAGCDRHRRYVLDYLDAWRHRTTRNGGLTPDNVGPSGSIGELTGGAWWGGYYGYRWPHGVMTVLEPLLVGCFSASLVAGDLGELDLVRSQLDGLYARGRDDDGRRLVPQRHTDAGWTDEAPLDPAYALRLWAFSQEDEDRSRVQRDIPSSLPPVHELPLSEGLHGHLGQWFEFLQGRRPGYPEAIMEANLRTIDRKLAEIDADTTDPEEMDVHHWQDRNPLRIEALLQLTTGAPMPVYHGGLIHAAVRHFDPARRQPGLPDAVAALVENINATEVSLVLVNLDADEPRELILQSGMYGEHLIESATLDDAAPVHVGGRWLPIRLGAGAGARVRLRVARFSARPTYDAPWT
jgi:hypothetical protein